MKKPFFSITFSLSVLCLFALAGCGQGGGAEPGLRSTPISPPFVVKVRAVIAGDAITEDLLRQVLELSASRFIEMGVKLELAEIAHDRPEPEELLTLESFWNKGSYNYWKERWDRGETEPFLTIVYSRPLMVKGVSYYSGWSEGVCEVRGGFAVIHVKPGLLLKNALADAHEKGHLLGAMHDSGIEPPTIMHPDAGAYLGENESAAFSHASQSQILSCIRFIRGRGADLESGKTPAQEGQAEPDLWREARTGE